MGLIWLLLMGCWVAVQVFVASNDLRVQEAASQPTRLTYAVSAEHLLKDMAKVRMPPCSGRHFLLSALNRLFV